MYPGATEAMASTDENDADLIESIDNDGDGPAEEKTVMIMTDLFIQVLQKFRMMASTKIVMALI